MNSLKENLFLKISSILSPFKLISILLFSCPILLFFYCFFTFSTDFPFNDDIVLNNFLLLHERLSFTEKVLSFFQQYNEHRIAYTKLIMFLYYSIVGTLNYKVFMLLGISSILILLRLLVKQFSNMSYLALVPISILLFSPLTHENALWAMASLQNYTVVLFMVLAIYFITQNKLIFSIVFFVLSVSTSASSMILAPVGFVLYLLQRENKSAFYWLVVSIIAIFLYYTNYTQPDYYPGKSVILERLKHPKELIAIIAMPSLLIEPIFSQHKINTALNYAFGFLIFSCYISFGIEVLKTYFKKEKTTKLFLFGITTICLAIIVLTFFLRNGKQESRYMIYPLLLTACTYLYLFSKINVSVKGSVFIKIFVWVSVAFSFVFMAYTYAISLSKFANKRIEMQVFSANFELNNRYFFFRNDSTRTFDDHETMQPVSLSKLPIKFPSGLHGFRKGDMKFINDVMAVSLKQGVCRFTPETDSLIKKMLVETSIEKNKQSSKAQFEFPFFIVRNPAGFTYHGFDESVFVLFKSNKHNILFPVNKKASSIKTILKKGDFIQSDFEEKIHYSTLPNDKYEIYLFSFYNNEVKILAKSHYDLNITSTAAIN